MNIMETPAAAGATWSQGLTFRRNFAEISVFFSFPLVTGIRNFGIFRYISFQNSKFNKFRPKSTEIRRNSPKFRNGIPFPPITGISPENEMVNPAADRGTRDHLIVVADGPDGEWSVWWRCGGTIEKIKESYRQIYEIVNFNFKFLAEAQFHPQTK